MALCFLALVGYVDWVMPHDISLSLFYLAPVSLAAWFVGRRAGIAFSLLSCAVWYAADQASGYVYANSTIPVWNALVRLGFFLVTAFLLAALRRRLSSEEQFANTDTLTGLLNGRAFKEKLEYTMALAGRNGNPLTLAYIDLDGFKQINDAHGHSKGDWVLHVFAEAITGSTRRSDTAARLGGDEFAVLLPGMEFDGATEAIAKLRRRVAKAFQDSGTAVTCSIGVVTFKKAPPDAGAAIHAADALMYEVKRGGKDSVAFRVLDQ